MGKSLSVTQQKALASLAGMARHAAKTGNPDMAWCAAGSINARSATLFSLVSLGLVEIRHARGVVSRRYDYRIKHEVAA